MKSSLLFVYLIICLHSFAQKPGTLDSSFGENGFVRTPRLYSSIGDAIMLPGNKLLVSGGTLDSIHPPSNMIRYLPNGSIDTSFGNDNYAEIFGGLLNLCSNNKIQAAGSGLYQVYLARYSFEGVLDTSFGKNGIDSFTMPYNTWIKCITIDAKNKILLAGSVQFKDYSTAAVILRFNADGKIDSTFAGKGYTIIADKYHSEANDIVTQKDGKIIFGGKLNTQPSDFLIMRFNENGSRDSTYGKNGTVISRFNGAGQVINSLQIQDNGRLVAAGYGNYFSLKHMCVARYNIDGSLDTSFNNVGWKFVEFGTSRRDVSETKKILLQKNSKIILAGIKGSTPFDYALARISSNGSIDSGFAMNGLSDADYGSDVEYCSNALLQDDGKIIMIGDDEINETYLLIRYYGDSTNQPRPIAKKIIRWLKNHTLNWQYNDDANVAYYSIQESSNGINGFKEIAKINGHQSLVNSEYSYNLNNSTVNSQKSSINYYKIIAVSKSGNVISDAISDETFITISPNPVKDILNISGLPANQKSTINIINRNGNILQSAICNNIVCNMNISQLKSGVYNVQVISNGTSQTIKFIKE